MQRITSFFWKKGSEGAIGHGNPGLGLGTQISLQRSSYEAMNALRLNYNQRVLLWTVRRPFRTGAALRTEFSIKKDPYFQHITREE